MSSIPQSNAKMVSELFGYRWDSDYDRDVVAPAIQRVFLEYEDLLQFCENMREMYGEQQIGWRDFRNYTTHDLLDRDFDRDELIRKIDHEIDVIRQERESGGIRDLESVANKRVGGEV